MTVDEDYNYKELQEECREYLRKVKFTPGKIVNCPPIMGNTRGTMNYDKCNNMQKPNQKNKWTKSKYQAGKTLGEVITEKTTLIARTAKQLATLDGRKTVQRKDIQLAIELLL